MFKFFNFKNYLNMIKLPIITVDFNTPLLLMDRMRQKIVREIEDLKNTINQLDLLDTHTEQLYSRTAE